MKHRASATPMFASAAPPRSPDTRSWGQRLYERVLGLPSIEEAERRLRSRPGFFASLTPEQWAAIRAYEGPEVLGPANGPKRKF